MPLTPKGQKIMANMQRQYGAEKGERVFYASRNKGIISGVDPGHAFGGGVPFGGRNVPFGSVQYSPFGPGSRPGYVPPGGYAGGGIVEHDYDPDLPRHQDDATIVPLTQYPPAYLETIQRLLNNQRRLQGLDRYYP